MTDACEHSWRWRRKRNEDRGWWECIACSLRLGPVALTPRGEPTIGSPRTCEQCGTAFLSRRPRARFHHDRCRVAWHKAHPLAGDPVAVFLGKVAGIRRRRPARRLPREGAGT